MEALDLTVTSAVFAEEGQDVSNRVLLAIQPYMHAQLPNPLCSGDAVRLGQSIHILSSETKPANLLAPEFAWK